MQMKTLSYPHFLGSEIANTPADQACFHVIPVPYEKTVSYGNGTGLGPSAILEASWQLETWDGKSNPSLLGIHSKGAIPCDHEAKDVIDRIAENVRDSIELKAIPVAIGGEHTVTYGVIQGLLNAGLQDFGVVQIDAHADLRDIYDNDPLSHACAMKRIVDLDIPLYQLGIRAFCEEEITTRESHNIHYRDADDIVAHQVQHIDLPDDFPKNVFFTLDIDGMDPSIFPSTGTPVPGGLGWYQTLNLFESVAKQRHIIGFDVMEFSPIQGFHAYEFAAAQLIYKMMGIVQRNQHVGKSQ